MPRHQVDDIRNVALVGHGAVGKTTLADLMLFKTGKNSRAGSVDDGTSLFDTEEDEKERKHSITAAVGHFDHDGRHVNLVDTPGMPDFVGHLIGALRGVETAALCVSAPSGIEVNTRKSFQYAGEEGLARFVVFNKLDGDNIDFPALVESLREMFGPACALMNVPVGVGSDFSGVVSSIDVPGEVPAGAVMDPAAAGQQVIDAAVEADEDLMERYLEGEELTGEELSGAISKAIIAGTLIPVFCTSAKEDIGVQELLDGLARYAPSPADMKRTATREGDTFRIEPKADGPLIAQVFKTRIDPFVAKMSFLRVFSGSLHKDQSVQDSRTGRSIKISQLLEVQGGQSEAVSDAGPGDIVAVVKIDELKTGDTLTDGAQGVELTPIPFPRPMIGLAVEPKTQADQTKISGALHKIEEEDPTFVVRRDAQTKEMVINGMSELHLQLIQNRLHAREKVDIITHQPKVPYRETVSGSAEGSYRHKKQSGGSGQFAEVHFRISSCPQDIDPDEYFTKSRFESMRSFHYDPELNYCFVDRVTGGSVPNQFIPAVEKGIRERMEQGVIAGNQVQDVVVELFFGKDHPVDSNETAFKMAASMCFREIFQKARPTLLEPIVEMEITVPGDKIGDVTSDLNSRRGRMEGMDEAPGGFSIIRAKAPLAEVMTYARGLSSMTGGQGSFTLEFSHYEMVPPNEQAKIVAAAKSDEEEH
ncbi:Elongation factor G [Maioricimonas rarisocia]|uniref:Elongation factor G n=1 Tax=Maioricimonas rarisocia TaxID=2528026 RepID=A0A517ZCF7_9PLAN|nr:elongation factor G [Maioricimonas rarisocia]QDU40183.1 Elongation factor G [Maioricimonas rarisocia]